MTVIGNLVDSEPRSLGAELSVGPLAFGCWRFVTRPHEELAALVHAALDAGMNLIDNADVYGLNWGGSAFGEAEENLGRVLAAEPSLRDRMVLATKGGIIPGLPYDSSAPGITAACEASLRRLGTDVVDLYQIHRPDLFAHPAELAAALSDLRAAGKIREVGVSNYTPSQHEALAAHLPFEIVCTQPEYSAAQLAPLRDGTFDLCMRRGVIPLAWSPLAGGRLATGEGISGELLGVLDDLAEREDSDRAAVALAFVLAHPTRPVAIVGSQHRERLRQAAQAVNVSLDRADVYRIVQASEGKRLP